MTEKKKLLLDHACPIPKRERDAIEVGPKESPSPGREGGGSMLLCPLCVPNPDLQSGVGFFYSRVRSIDGIDHGTPWKGVLILIFRVTSARERNLEEQTRLVFVGALLSRFHRMSCVYPPVRHTLLLAPSAGTPYPPLRFWSCDTAPWGLTSLAWLS
jgi:hypothetical protein